MNNFDVISVRSFGARGNGVADDTAAAQAAINAVPPEGGIVYFPPGTYAISSPLRVSRGRIRLCGATRGMSKLWARFVGPLVLTGPLRPPLATSPSLVPGPGASLNFRGRSYDEYLNLRDSPSVELDGLTQLCVECFFAPADLAGMGQLFGSHGRLFSTDAFTSAFSLFRVGDQVQATVTVNGTAHTLTTPLGTLSVGKTYHIALTVDGAGSETTIRLYVYPPGTGPNAPVVSLTLPGKAALTQSPYENVVIGPAFFSWPCAGGAYYSHCGGDLDSIRISRAPVYPERFSAPKTKAAFVPGQTLLVIRADHLTDSSVVIETSTGAFHCAVRYLSMGLPITDVEICDLGFIGGGLDVFRTPNARLWNLAFDGVRYGLRLKNNSFFSAVSNVDIMTAAGDQAEFGIENSDASGVNHYSQLKIVSNRIGMISYGSSVTVEDANIECWTDFGAVFSGAFGASATIDIRNPIINDEGAPGPAKNAILAFDSVVGAHVSGGILQYLSSPAPLIHVTGETHLTVTGTVLCPHAGAEEFIHVDTDSAPKDIALVAPKLVQPAAALPLTRCATSPIRMVA